MLRLFYMDISCGCSDEQSQAFYKVLPQKRQEKIDKMANRELAEKRLLSGIFMQYGLSLVTGIPMEDIRYVYGDQGKPYLDKSIFGKVENGCGECLKLSGMWDEKEDRENMDFSLSHSGKYAVLAVSNKPVGIDVERQKKNRLLVAKRCFHENEYADIMALPDEGSRNRRFLEYWTMKEAYVKRMGEGLRIPLRSFEIKRGEEKMSYVEAAEGNGGAGEHGLKSGIQDGRVWFATGVMEHGEYAVSVCSENREELESLTGFADLLMEERELILRMSEVKKEQIMKEI